MKYIAVCMLLGLFGLAACTQEYHFEGNVTVPDPDGALSFRKTWLIHNPVQHWFGFRSINFHLDNDSLEIDTLGGFISYDSIPFAIMAYFELDKEWDEDSFEVDVAKNVMAKAYFQLAEVDENDEEVAIYGIGGDNDQSIDWDIETHLQGDLKYFKMSATMETDNGSGGNGTAPEFYLEVTWFISQVTGMVNLANTTITPRMIESVIRISNYTYADDSNHLRLKILAAHGGINVQTKGSKVETGDGLETMYVRLATTCHVVPNRRALWGVPHGVVVSAWKRAQNLKQLIMKSHAKHYLNAKWGNNWDVMIATVDFPAGATDIVYDPTLGTGQTKAVQNSDASSLFSPSLLLLALSALVGSFFW